MTKALIPLKAAPLEADDAEAWWSGRIPRRLLVVPFGGPIPGGKAAPLGVDLDGEWFSPRTDVHGPYPVLRRVRERLVDWHHSGDPTGVMQSYVIGKAVLDNEPDDEGWWADFWFKAGEARVKLIRKLAERGAQLFGSSEATSKADVRKVAETGEILQWPVLFETLSTSPQNTLSVFRPAKARIDEALEAGETIDDAIRSLASELDVLAANLQSASATGPDAAKGGHAFGAVDDASMTAVARLGDALERTEELARSLRRS